MKICIVVRESRSDTTDIVTVAPKTPAAKHIIESNQIKRIGLLIQERRIDEKRRRLHGIQASVARLVSHGTQPKTHESRNQKFLE